MFLQDFKPTLKFRKSIFLESVDFSFCFFILQHINRLKKEARERGEEYKVTKLRRNLEMDEYDFIHWRRSLEEREALLRDISWYSFTTPLYELSVFANFLISCNRIYCYTLCTLLSEVFPYKCLSPLRVVFNR